VNNSKRSSKGQLVQESQGQRVYVEQSELVSMTHPRTVREETRRRHVENEFATECILDLEIRRLLDSLRPIPSRWTRWFDEEMVGGAIEDV
jgi:hypothetical protein